MQSERLLSTLLRTFVVHLFESFDRVSHEHCPREETIRLTRRFDDTCKESSQSLSLNGSSQESQSQTEMTLTFLSAVLPTTKISRTSP